MRRQPSFILAAQRRAIIFGRVPIHTARRRMVHRDTKLSRPLDSALRHALEIGTPALQVAIGVVGERSADLGLGERLEGHFAFLVGVLAAHFDVLRHSGAAVTIASAGSAVRVWC